MIYLLVRERLRGCRCDFFEVSVLFLNGGEDRERDSPAVIFHPSERERNDYRSKQNQNQGTTPNGGQAPPS